MVTSLKEILSTPIERKPTGLRDVKGVEIHTGDIVEFYFDLDFGCSSEPNADFTRMRDLVVEINNKIFFVCAYGAAFAHRYVDYCTVIGNDPALIDT